MGSGSPVCYMPAPQGSGVVPEPSQILSTDLSAAHRAHGKVFHWISKSPAQCLVHPSRCLLVCFPFHIPSIRSSLMVELIAKRSIICLLVNLKE